MQTEFTGYPRSHDNPDKIEDFAEVSYFCVKSKERINHSSKSVTHFQIEPYPKASFIRSASLLSAEIPFPFKNVTSTYGDQLYIRVYPDKNNLLVFYDIPIHLPHVYLTTSQLLETINTEIQRQIIIQAIPFNFAISISIYNGYLQMSTTEPLSRIDFLPAMTTQPQKYYAFTMIGANTTSPTVFTDFDTILTDWRIFPHAYTESLPFQYLFLTINPFPACTHTAIQSNTHFVIPCAKFRPNISLSTTENKIGEPVTFRNNVDFIQHVLIQATLAVPHRMEIILTDEYMNSVEEHAGTIEWSFLLQLFLQKKPNNRY